MSSIERHLLKYIRYIVLIGSIVTAIGLYMFYGLQQLNTLLKIYALTAISLLYITLLIGPFYDAFRIAPGRAVFTKARRAIGVSTFIFAALHGSSAFFGQLGGFAGLSFLPKNYIVPVSLGIISLLILTLMAATSFDYWTKKLGRHWKQLHRLIYLVGWLVLFHAFLLGSDFTSPNSVIARLAIVAVAFLLILQALRLDMYVIRRQHASAHYGSLFVILTATIVAVAYSLLVPGGSTIGGLSVHTQHLQVAKDNQQTTSTIPGITGDKTKRYTVQFDRQDETVHFTVTDAANGNPVSVFTTVYEKPAHLIIVNDNLTYFDHIHPTVSGNTFTATVHVPTDGKYRLYLDFQPAGAIEQQFAFTATFGTSAASSAPAAVSYDAVKTFGQYEVSLEKPAKLSASQLSIGNQQLTFTIRDATTKQPMTNLKPYLAAFGHLVMIRQGSYEYIHVHPADLTIPAATATGGPTVAFLPLGIYGPIKAGTYHVFAQFNPDGQLFTADFWVKVEE